METGMVFIGADIDGPGASASLLGPLSMVPSGLRVPAMEVFEKFPIYTGVLFHSGIFSKAVE